MPTTRLSLLPNPHPKNMLIRVDGELAPGVTSKDLVLHVCGQLLRGMQ